MPTLASRARRSRRGQHFMVTAVVALIVATIAVVPLVERSFSAELVDYRVRQLAPVSAQVELDARRDTGPDPATLEKSLDPRLRALTDAPIATTGVVVTWLGLDVLVQVNSTADQCAHVRIVTGRCPTATDELMVPQSAIRAQQTAGLKVGAAIKVQQSDRSAGELPVRTLKVVGAYTATASQYWGGVSPDNYTPPNPQRSQPNQTWLIAPTALLADARDNVQGWFSPYYSVRFPLNRAAVTDVTLPAAVTGAARTEATLPTGVLLSEPLTKISEDTATDLGQVGQLVPLLFVQLLILVLILAYQVFSHLTAVRRGEMAVLKMRGHDQKSLRRFAIGEFAPSFAWGLPAGLLLAYLVDAGICRFILPGNSWPQWNWWALGLAAAAVVVSAALGLLVWSRTSRSPIIELMRAAPPRRRGVPTALAVAGALALAGVVLAATGNLTGAPALLVPTLAAIVLASIVAASLVRVGSAAVRALFGAGRATGALAVAQTVRRPGVAPVLTTLIIATTLLSFSTSLLVRGNENRQARATADLGASVVVGASSTVTGAVDPKALQAAVDAVDPGHRWLTPVVQISASSPESLASVGVIPADMVRIAATDGIPQPIPWDRLRPPGNSTTPNAIVPGAPASGQVTAPAMNDQDGTFNVTGSAPYLPGIPQRAVVADLATLLAAGDRTDNLLEYVWSSSTDPSLLQRLTRELTDRGFNSINVNTLAAQRATYDATATAWSMRVSVLLGAVAVLVALLSVATMIVTTRRQRIIDLQSLRAAGVPDRTLRRATVLEFVLVSVVATLLGAIAAPVGASIVGEGLPWWSTPPEYPVTRTGFVWTAGIGAVVALLVVLVVLAVVVGQRTIRRGGERQ